MTKILTTILIAFAASFAMAQNNNLVVSSIHVFDNGDGTGDVQVRISGPGASNQVYATATVTGDRIPGGIIGTGSGMAEPTLTGGNNTGGGQGNSAVLTMPISLLSPTMGGSDFVEINLSVSGGTAIIIGNRNRIRQTPGGHYN